MHLNYLYIRREDSGNSAAIPLLVHGWSSHRVMLLSIVAVEFIQTFLLVARLADVLNL